MGDAVVVVTVVVVGPQGTSASRLAGASGVAVVVMARRLIGVDPDARAGMEWGLAGVPETFVIGPDGKVVFRAQGPLNAAIMQNQVLPLIEELTR